MNFQQKLSSKPFFALVFALVLLAAISVSGISAQEAGTDLPQQSYLPLSMAIQAAQVALGDL